MKSCDALMLCHDVDRGSELDGKFYSQLIDPVRMQLIQQGYSVSVMSHPYSAVQKGKIFGQTYSMNRKYFLMKSLEKIIRKSSKSRETFEESNEFQFWVELLRSLNCRFIVLIGAPPALCLAASKLKILVVEIFHGFGYHRIPWGYENRKLNELPTHFISFDMTSLKTFQSHFGSVPKTFIASRPNLENELGLAQYESSKTKESSAPWGQKVTVLVSLGWMEFVNGKMLEISKSRIWPKVIDEIQGSAEIDIQWVIRPHPVMLREKRFGKHISELERRISMMDNCYSIKEATASLPSLLEQIDVHLTSFSEIAFETALAGVPTLFLSDEVGENGQLSGRFDELFSSGLAEVSDGQIATMVTWLRNAKRSLPSFKSQNIPSVMDVLTEEIIPSGMGTLQ